MSFTPEECPWCGNRQIEPLNGYEGKVWNCNNCNSYIEEEDVEKEEV